MASLTVKRMMSDRKRTHLIKFQDWQNGVVQYANEYRQYYSGWEEEFLTVSARCISFTLQSAALSPEIMMSTEKRNEEKRQTLRLQGTLNPRPQAVTHELFQESDFFDPNDLVQVKYEMLRQVQSESRPVSQSAKAFGLSRPSFYQAQAALAQAGLAGLVPQKRGPKEGHKLTAAVMEFLLAARAKEPSLNTQQLAEMVAQNFQLRVHPRSIERQLRREKKRR